MGFSLGSIFNGIVSGVESLVETGNPIAAGAGAIATMAGGGTTTPQATYDPLLDQMSGDLNPGNPPQIYSYSQVSGQSSKGANPDFGSIISGDGDDG
jgi:hypothetical protein